MNLDWEDVKRLFDSGAELWRRERIRRGSNARHERGRNARTPQITNPLKKPVPMPKVDSRRPSMTNLANREMERRYGTQMPLEEFNKLPKKEQERRAKQGTKRYNKFLGKLSQV